MNTSDGREYYGFGIDNSQLRREAQQAINIFDGIGSKAEAEGARIDASFRRAGQAFAAYLTAQQLSSFVGSVVKMRGEIEALEISFETLIGNKDKAKEFFGEIKDFAVNTPLQMNTLAKGAQTMLGFNIELEKVMPLLRQIGDISMGDAQKFDSLVLAFSQMSSTGKLMGQDLLQMINAGFNPLVEMSKITGKSLSELEEDMSAGAISADMVAEAFAHAAGKGGIFNGMLEKQSHGLKGAISNLQGAWDDMLNDIGSKHQEVFVDAIQTVTELAKSYEGVGKVIAELIATYGVYKAAVITLSTVENLRYQSTLAHMAGLTKMQAVMEVLKAKTDALNVAMAKNPYMLAAAAVAALAYGIYKLTTYQTDAEKAQKKLNEATKQYEQGAASEQIQIDRLFAKLNAATEGTEEYEDAKKAIINQYGQYLQGLDKEKAALNDVAGAYKAITEAAKEAARARAMQSFSQSAADEYGKKIGDERESLRKALEKQYKGKKGADGIGLAETYFWKIVPVLEGKEKMTKEIEDMIKPLDKTHFVQGDPMTGIGAYSYTSNAAREAIANAAKARKVYDDVMKDAETRFGSLPAKDSGKPGQEEAKKATVKNREFWENEKKSLQKTLDAMSDAELKTQKAKDLRKKIADAQAKIDAYNVQKTAKGSKDYAKDNDAFFRLKDAQTIERERAAKDAEFAVRQAEIDAKQESSEKIREQMELDHAKELEMLDREKADYLQRKVDNARALFEANPANKGKVFNGSNITLTPEENASFAQRKKYTEQKQANEGQELVERQRTTMNEYLKEFGDYMEKRQAIIDLYNAQMAKATTEGERLSLSATMKRELSELDIEAKKSTAAISRLFEDMTDKTVKNMRDIADAGEQALQFLISGEWDEAKGIEFGMSQETFDTLRKSPAELEKIRKAIKQIREEADKSDTAFNKMANGLKKVFAAGNDTKKLKDGLGMIEDGLNDVMNVAGFLSNSLSNLGDALGSDALKGAADGISAAMDVASSTMSGAQAGAMFGPWGAAAGAAIGLVSSLGSAIAKLHDAKHEKKIKKLQEQIEVLEKSYDKLGRSVEKAYSKDASKMIEQQNTLLEQQKVLIRNQIAEEKAKKKTDWDRIKEWENQIEEIDQLIADNKEKAVDAIFGEDLKSAIDNFASAYAEAWASNGDKAKSAKDVVKKMMQQMVTESIKAAIQSSKSMEQIRQKLQEFYADNVLSPWEQDYIYRMAENLQKELDDQFGWADSLMYEGSSASQDSTKRGFATASQDSIDELNGRFTAIQLNSEANKITLITISDDVKIIRLQVIANRESMEEIRNLALLAVGHLETIAKNTKQLFEMNERLGKIEKNTRKL
jgi:tape measure domain-containing protein